MELRWPSSNKQVACVLLLLPTHTGAHHQCVAQYGVAQQAQGVSLRCMHRGVMHFMSYLCSLHTAQLTHALADWLLQLKARKHCYFSHSRNSGNICRTETACTHTAHAGSASNKPRTKVPYSLCHSAAHANVTQHHCLYMTSKKHPQHMMLGCPSLFFHKG